MIRDLSAAECGLLARAVRLRAAAYGLQGAGDAAEDFSRDLSRSWADSRVRGMASACHALSLVAAEVPGAWEVYAEARDLAREAAAVSRGVSS